MEELSVPVTILSRGVPVGTAELTIYQPESDVRHAPYLGFGVVDTTRAYRAIDARVRETSEWDMTRTRTGPRPQESPGSSVVPLLDQGLDLELHDSLGARLPASGVLLVQMPYADESVRVHAQFLTAEALVGAVRLPRPDDPGEAR